MKLLRDILYRAPITDSFGTMNLAVPKVVFDSRKVVRECMYIALRGTVVDGHKFIEQAIEDGARSIICEDLPTDLKDGVTYVQVKNAHETLGIIAGNFYDNPSQELKLIGITGTNGKTTVATLSYKLFMNLGHRSGLLSTVKIMIGNQEYPATHTTPDPLQINEYLRKMVEAGCRFCFMEASSHGIAQRRVAGLQFAGAVFTNISRDHLDYHETFDNYILAKKKLFDQLPASSWALVNQDDRHGQTMLLHSKAKPYGFALRTAADFKVENTGTPTGWHAASDGKP